MLTNVHDTRVVTGYVYREVYSGGTFRKSMNYYSFREKEAKNIVIDFLGRYLLNTLDSYFCKIVEIYSRTRYCIVPMFM